MSTHELGPLPESVERAIRKFGMECAYGDHAARVFGALQIREEMKAYALAEVARAVEAERERCAQACERVAYTHAVTSLLGPEQNALKCAAAIREGAR